MNITKLALQAGAGVLTAIFPPAAALIPVINGMLPDDKKLPENATGDQVSNAIKTLPPEKVAELEALEIKAKMNESNNWASVQGILNKADETGNTTRPKIALMFARQIVITCNVISAAVAYAIFTGDEKIIDVINQVWPIILAFIGPMTTVIYQYFGKRTQEKRDRISAASGQPQSLGLVANIIQSLGKR